MQGPILQALALTCVGNAYLSGRDVRGFWPESFVFNFTRLCEFRVVDDKDDKLVATDPLAWFETLRGAHKGLRLHNAPRPRGPGQTIPVEERMMVGFVGGGPAWLIEAVGERRSQLWQGHDRLGNRTDPDRKIWLTAYLLAGETEPQDYSATPLSLVTGELDSVLVEIEALARRIDAGNFAECFAQARAELAAPDDAPRPAADDFIRYAGFDPQRAKLLQAMLQAWVFGGMGSWNDIGAADPWAADYDRLSEQLFRALNDGICALANSTYRG